MMVPFGAKEINWEKTLYTLFLCQRCFHQKTESFSDDS